MGITNCPNCGAHYNRWDDDCVYCGTMRADEKSAPSHKGPQMPYAYDSTYINAAQAQAMASQRNVTLAGLHNKTISSVWHSLGIGALQGINMFVRR